jgi:hypothetical protein
LPAVRARAVSAAQSPAARQAVAAVSSGAGRARRGAEAGYRGAGAVARRMPRGRIATIIAALAAGWALAFFLDSHSGRRRRALVRDKLAHSRRVVSRDIPRAARRRLRFAGGLARRVQHGATEMVPHHLRHGYVDNETLVARVRSEALRGDGIKSGEIHVDAYEGCVTLRGQLDAPDKISRIVAATSRIDGVTEVRSYLHLPGTLPPNKAEALVNGHSPPGD